MNLFKTSYKVVRNNSDEIYKGFGFKHKSDATQYYVHPNNQSYKGTTTLCQPIGEAILLFATLLRSIMNGQPIGDYYISEDHKTILLDIKIPQDYRNNQVVDSNIYQYKAIVENQMIRIAAYDSNKKWIESNMDHLRTVYKLLPTFMVLLAREIENNEDYHTLMEEFVMNPVADSFVNLHEDFYQNHKMDDDILEYSDLSYMDTTGYRSFSSSYEIIRENKNELNQKENQKIIAFSINTFNEEQKTMIPHLSSEFVLPENLISICNAISSGDMLAILLHGPAGTGKTMSCKLIAQAIGLPIMETINCTENLDEFVLGKYIPCDDKIIFKESYVTKAIREGGGIVFEEINFAKPQHLAFLNSLLDDNGFVRLDNGEMVKRNPNFRFFATMNLGYFGTKELNQALYNRFNSIIEISALSDEAISRMLITRVPECKNVVDKILGVYHKIKRKIESEELDVVISPRNLENWARLAKYDGYIKAAEKTIIPIAKCDRVLENTIRGIIVLYKWS
ncbi:MAG: AAA family ATPase [Traorella sp.]